jgi:flavin reductase (DIM6/NTAB) family NADH-FMN oxidoreductase RutF
MPTDRGPAEPGGLVTHQTDELTPFFERVDYAYYVVTARTDEGALGGCLAGFVTQCSIVPPNFLVCISKVNHTFDVAQRSSALGLHLLGGDQEKLARRFGEETGDLVDKFAGLDWERGQYGAPLLAESAVSLECVVLGHFSVGDHEAFLVRGTGSVDRGRPGLLTYRTAPPLTPGHPVPG